MSTYKLHTINTDSFNDVGEGGRKNGEIWYRSDTHEIKSFQNGALHTLFDKTGTPPSSVKFSGSLTRANDAGSATQQITGLGFRPAMIHFIGNDDQAPANRSSGWSDGTVNASINGLASNIVKCITITDGANGHNASVTMDPDGFTVDWAKVGAGLNITIKYIAIK